MKVPIKQPALSTSSSPLFRRTEGGGNLETCRTSKVARLFDLDLREYTPGSWDERTPIVRHFILEGVGIDAELLDGETLKRAMVEYAKLVKLKVVADFIHQFSPQGVSAVFIIQESHLAVHSWPEKNYLHLDLVTCSKKTDTSSIEHVQAFNRVFDPEDVRTLKLKY